MEDNNLTRLTAKVMGWEAFPLDRDDYDNPKYGYPRLVQQLDGNGSWAVFRCADECEDWSPLTRMDHAIELAEKARADGRRVEIEMNSHSDYCKVSAAGDRAWHTADPGQLPRAITLAILEQYGLL